MPIHPRISTLTRQLASQFSSDTAEQFAVSFSELNRSLLSAQKQIEKILSKEWEKQAAFRQVLARLIDLLKLRLSEEVSAKDVLQIFAEYYLLSSLLNENEKQSLEEDSLWYQLAHAHRSLRAAPGEKINISEIKDTAEKLTSQLTRRADFYSLLPGLFQPRRMAFPLPNGTWQYALAQSRYLLLRKLGISLGSEPLSVLSCQLSSEQLTPLFSIATDMKHQVLTSHVTLSSYVADLLMASARESNELELSACFVDVIVSEFAGQQTSLFTTLTKPDCVQAIRNMSFDLGIADLSLALPAYSYHSKAYSQLDQEIVKAKAQQGKPGMLSRMVVRLVGKAATKSLLLLSVDRQFLLSAETKPMRKYLSRSFEEIYVLDLPSESEEGQAFIFMLRKQVTAVKEEKAKIMYSKLSSEAKNWPEEIDWIQVEEALYSYWIGFTESDFFSFLPLYTDDGKGIFLEKCKSLSSLTDYWLMDHDEKQLRKKVTRLFKAYENLKKGKVSEQISWPESLKKMAEAGISLSFDEKKILEVSLSPFVKGYLYAEEKLLLTFSEEKALWWQSAWQQVYPACMPAFRPASSVSLLLPLTKSADSNISEEGLSAFRKFYEERSQNLPASLERFPPAPMTALLEQMSQLSQDLPVIRKYPLQINKKLEAAEAFASQPKLLIPLKESLEEFRQTIFRLERDAVERRGLYQRIRGLLAEFEQALSNISKKQHEAVKELAAVNEENIFYYSLAVLASPQYREKYSEQLKQEIPRIPMLADFRQWSDWGRDIFQLVNNWQSLEPYPLKVENKEKGDKAVKYFSSMLMSESASLHLKEEKIGISLLGLPKAAFAPSYFGRSPLEHYLDYMQNQSKLNAKQAFNANSSLLIGREKLRVNEIQQLCTLCLRLEQLRQEMTLTNI